MTFKKSSVLAEATVGEREALITKCVLRLMQISVMFETCIYILLVYHVARLETHVLSKIC